MYQGDPLSSGDLLIAHSALWWIFNMRRELTAGWDVVLSSEVSRHLSPGVASRNTVKGYSAWGIEPTAGEIEYVRDRITGGLVRVLYHFEGLALGDTPDTFAVWLDQQRRALGTGTFALLLETLFVALVYLWRLEGAHDVARVRPPARRVL